MTETQLKTRESAEFHILRRLLGELYTSAWRLSYVAFIELAAKKVCITLPMAVRIRLNMLRYGGHVARRKQFLDKRGEHCVEMELAQSAMYGRPKDLARKGPKKHKPS